MNSRIVKLIQTALAEDIGAGDVTTEATIPSDAVSSAVLLAKQGLVLAGIDICRQVFHTIDPSIQFQASYRDGDRIERGAEIGRASGNTRALLSGERVALNLLQHLSGIATLTAKYVEQLSGTKARILDTRKTVPGLRELEKYAVRMGGGQNHRMGLYDMILIKDNHIKASGGITAAVSRARQKAGHLRIEVEAGTLEEVREALEAKADVIMLDNMQNNTMREAVALIAGRAVVEASGNVTLETVRGIAETGVDWISSGSLTHSAAAADISMKIR